MLNELQIIYLFNYANLLKIVFINILIDKTLQTDVTNDAHVIQTPWATEKRLH